MNRLERELQNLKDQFPPMPDACHQALMNAARSVKEEEKMKKFTMRTVLVTALILALTAAVALAAGQLGLKDLLGNHGTHALPSAAQEIMENSEKKTFHVGPVSVTLEETLADILTNRERRSAVVESAMKLADRNHDPALVQKKIREIIEHSCRSTIWV